MCGYFEKCKSDYIKVTYGYKQRCIMNYDDLKIKQKAYSNVQVGEFPKQSDLGYNDLQYLLYLQFWLMYQIHEYGNVEQSKLKSIAGKFERAYGVVDLNMRREKKLKETFCKMSRGEDVDLTTDDCADFTQKDWEAFGKGLNKYFSCAADAAKNGKV